MEELKPKNLRWLVEENPRVDLCLHGGVYLRINDTLVVDDDADWTLSAASYFLLKTVRGDYDPAKNPNRHLIPCCGHLMLLSPEEDDGLCICECSNGINWTIKHTGEDVI